MDASLCLMGTCFCVVDACVFDVNVFLCDRCLCDSPHLSVMDACAFDGNMFLCVDAIPMCLMEMCFCVWMPVCLLETCFCVVDGNVFLCGGCLCV